MIKGGPPPSAKGSFFFDDPKLQTERAGNASAEAKAAGGEDDALWSQILKGANSSRVLPNKNILILGDNGSGKSTVLDAIRNPMGTLGDLDQGSQLALTYSFFEVLDEDAEEPAARIGLYELSSDDAFSPLVRYVIDPETLANSLVVLCLDWTKPWRFFHSLEKYLGLLQKHILNMLPSNSPILSAQTERLESYIRDYKDTASAAQGTSNLGAIKSDSMAFSLGPGVLTQNLGIPIIVACTKSDGMTMLERELSYSEDQFDFIQQSLRTVCLKYGASLFYVSTHRPATLSTLRSYIMHRLLWKAGSPLYSFDEKLQVVDRDTIRVPAGWDSWGMIRVQRDGFSCEALAGIEEGGASRDYEKELAAGRAVYEEEVKIPETDKVPSFTINATISAEDEQVFLERNMELLSAMSGALSGGNASPMTTNITENMASRLTTGSAMSSNDMLDDVSQKLARLAKLKEQSSSTTASRDKIPLPSSFVPNAMGPAGAAVGSSATQNEVLANFFQSLLTKKSSGGAPTSGRSSSVSGTRAGSSSMSLGGGGSSHGINAGGSPQNGSPPSGSPKQG
ncbi:hypothetical protein HDU67_005987 [Dinochytrium kinnereticum]|nr:hypothetical protein HDU67_005987 [Dinochytrium kinnereticum]